MWWFIGVYLILIIIFLLFNHGAHMDDDKFDNIILKKESDI
jgi:hypothetical protein